MDYPEFFRNGIILAIQHVLDQLQIPNVMLSTDERAQALHLLSYSLNLSQAWSVTRALLLELTPQMDRAGYSDEWIPYLEKGIAQSRIIQDSATEAQLNLQLGLAFQRKGELNKASGCYQSCISQFSNLDDSHNQATALNRLAYIARMQRRHTHAIQHVEAALDLLASEAIERELSYFVLGTIAYDQSQWEDAARYFEQSLEIWEQQGNNRMMAIRLGNLGSALRRQQKFEHAIDCYQRSLALLEEIQDRQHYAVMTMNLGNIYNDAEEPQKALDLYTSISPMLREAKDEIHLAMLETNIGIANRKLGRWKEAQASLITSQERWQRIGNIKSAVNTGDELGLTYLEQGYYAKALKTFKYALNQLKQLQDDPEYPLLLKTLTEHLKKTTF